MRLVMPMLVDVFSQEVAPLVRLGTLATPEEVVEATLVPHVAVKCRLYRVHSSAAGTPKHRFPCKHTALDQHIARLLLSEKKINLYFLQVFLL